MAQSIAQLTLCQVTGEEIATATKLFRERPDSGASLSPAPADHWPRQLHQLSCILDSCTITASYEVSQAQKALLLLFRTEKGSSTFSEEHYANLAELTHEDVLQEH